MRKRIVSCCLVLVGCGPPQLAVVGVLAAPDTVDAGEVDAGSAPVDAQPPAPLGADPPTDDAGACSVLPDLFAAQLPGTGSDSDGVRLRLLRALDCPASTADGGASSDLYSFTRVDDSPLLRAGKTYALSWPLPGAEQGVIGLAGGRLFGGPADCALGEPLGPLEIATSLSDVSGCRELHPTHDSSALQLVNAALVGIGSLGFLFCERSCDAP